MVARWSITRTPSAGRRNLFDLTPGSEHQIATIVSGSTHELARFEASLRLIEEAPRMLICLREALDALERADANETEPISPTRQRVYDLIAHIDGRAQQASATVSPTV